MHIYWAWSALCGSAAHKRLPLHKGALVPHKYENPAYFSMGRIFSIMSDV